MTPELHRRDREHATVIGQQDSQPERRAAEMKFHITFADGTTEEREMSDCSTVEQATNAVAGSTPGVTITEMVQAAPSTPTS